MKKNGFTLIELLGCLALLGVVLCIGLYVTRDTLSTSLSTLTDVSSNQIHDAATLYVREYKTNWINANGEEYACITMEQLVDSGYFDYDEVVNYYNDYIRLVREPKTRVIDSVQIVESCENLDN